MGVSAGKRLPAGLQLAAGRRMGGMGGICRKKDLWGDLVFRKGSSIQKSVVLMSRPGVRLRASRSRPPRTCAGGMGGGGGPRGLGMGVCRRQDPHTHLEASLPAGCVGVWKGDFAVRGPFLVPGTLRRPTRSPAPLCSPPPPHGRGAYGGGRVDHRRHHVTGVQRRPRGQAAAVGTVGQREIR